MSISNFVEIYSKQDTLLQRLPVPQSRSSARSDFRPTNSVVMNMLQVGYATLRRLWPTMFILPVWHVLIGLYGDIFQCESFSPLVDIMLCRTTELLAHDSRLGVDLCCPAL